MASGNGTEEAESAHGGQPHDKRLVSGLWASPEELQEHLQLTGQDPLRLLVHSAAGVLLSQKSQLPAGVLTDRGPR